MISLPGNLTIKTEIYGENKYHLINYHSLNLYEKSIKIENVGRLYYNNYSIFFEKNLFENVNKSLHLFSIDFKNNTYIIKTKGLSSDFLTYSNIPFIVLNKKKNDLYKLCENDIFKIGKLLIKVRKIRLINSDMIYKRKFKLYKNKSVKFKNHIKLLNILNNSTNKINLSQLSLNSSNQEKKLSMKNNLSKKQYKLKLKNNILSVNKKDFICRICYSSTSSINNPLINICKCDGSMKYIHYKCLKEWIDSQILKEDYKNKKVITYNENIFKCELCKEKYPEYIEYNNKLYNIIFYKPSFKEYCILETNIIEDDNMIKYYHIISLEEKNNICIGRNQKCDLYINEISLSNEHCYIRKENNNLFLEDNNSKFGTLVLIQNNIMKLIPSKLLRIQINNIYITFNYKIKSSLFSCFCAKEIDNYISYNKQNHKAIRNYDIVKKNFDIYINENLDENENNERNNMINNKMIINSNKLNNIKIIYNYQNINTLLSNKKEVLLNSQRINNSQVSMGTFDGI